MKHKSFTVPHDFTSVANVALDHAIETAKKANTTIHILHVVEDEAEVDSATDKIDDIIASKGVEGVTLTNNVRIGNIFKSISEFAVEHQSELIFMGTHGAHGWQHITGSYALRVVTSSQVPFVIVQDKAVKEGGYKSIVVPLDLHIQTRQKLSTVAKLAEYFGSKVHIALPDESDLDLQAQLEAHKSVCEVYLKERNIEMDTKILPHGDFDREVVKYASLINADLISIMNLNRSNIFSVFNAKHEQYIITNDALIPTLILNPVEVQEIYGHWFT
ncbi:MAG: universal stress protein [Cryomorphaceae bacterium]|nr:universal stress protein [Cryomorphaceae bacterium]